MADVLERLKPLCSTDATRPKLATPFAATFEGRKWAVATTGHFLAALPYDGELRTDGPDISAVIPPHPPTHRTTVAALRAWAGPPPLVECDECHGAGEVDHDCDCEFCSVDSTAKCAHCAGTGKVKATRPTHLLGGIVNRNLVHAAATTAPDDGEVTISHGGELDPYVFRADGWIAAVMPLAYAVEKISDDVLPMEAAAAPLPLKSQDSEAP